MKILKTIMVIIFWDFWCFTKFSFHHKWNEARLLVINMVYTSYLTSFQTTWDLITAEKQKLNFSHWTFDTQTWIIQTSNYK